MKRLLALSVALCIGAAMCACGSGNAAGRKKSAKRDRVLRQAETESEALMGNAADIPAAAESGETLSGTERRRQFLVEDTKLFEKMVRGRYYDLWSRRGIYFTDCDLAVYEQFLDRMEKNIAAYWDAKTAGALAAGQWADRDTYIRLLTMLICQQSIGFSQTAETLTDYDTLRTLPDLKDDLVEVGWDFLGAYADPSLTQEVMFSFGTELSSVADHIEVTVEDYQQLKAAAENYKNAMRLLDVVSKNAESPWLLEAAEDMKVMVGRAGEDLYTGDWKKKAGMVAGDVWENKELFAECLLDVLSAGIGEEDWIKELSESCGKLSKGVESVAPGISLFQATYHAMMIGGNGNFGTEDTFNRFAEMRALSEISSALSKEARLLKWENVSSDSGISAIREAVPILQFQILTSLRGEYCIRELVLEDGGLQSELLDIRADIKGLFGIEVPKSGEIRAWFEDEAEVFSEIYSDLDRILCTGDEAYYRYLQDEILPKYGWASLEARCPVENWNIAGHGSSASYLKEHPKATEEEDSLGVLAACVHDFDGDGLRDMLVIYTEAAPVSETKISPAYEIETEKGTVHIEGDALTLRFELFQLQYDAMRAEAAANEAQTAESAETGEDRESRESPFGQEVQSIGGNGQKGIPKLKDLLRDPIPPREWTPMDRYTVYSSADVKPAAEIGGLCMGRILAGVCSVDGIPYIYTYESMADVTTDGPWLLRFWHVEDGHFVLDYGDGVIGWGQGRRVEDVSSYLEAKGLNIADTGLSLVGNLLETSWSEEAYRQLTESDSLLLRMVLTTKDSGRPGGELLYQAKDYSLIREIIGKNDFARRMPEIPEFKPEENPWRAEMDSLAEAVGESCGFPMTASRNSESDGIMIVEYHSPSNRSALSVRMDRSGKLKAVLLSGVEEAEFIAVKDAVLRQESLKLDQAVTDRFLGDCSYGNMDFAGGSGYVNRVAEYVFGLNFD